MEPIFLAKRPFDPRAGKAWDKYGDWSGLSQLREGVSLDGMLCPTVPEALTPADWNYNVHADYLAFFFRSLEYLLQRVTGEGRLNILALLQNPTPAHLADVHLAGFDFAGFDLVDVHG